MDTGKKLKKKKQVISIKTQWSCPCQSHWMIWFFQVENQCGKLKSQIGL